MTYGIETYRYINTEELFEYHLNDVKAHSTCDWIYFECGYDARAEIRKIINTLALAILAFVVYHFTTFSLSRAYLLEGSLLFTTFYYIPLLIGLIVTARLVIQYWYNHNHYIQQQALTKQRKTEL